MRRQIPLPELLDREQVPALAEASVALLPLKALAALRAGTFTPALARIALRGEIVFLFRCTSGHEGEVPKGSRLEACLLYILENFPECLHDIEVKPHLCYLCKRRAPKGRHRTDRFEA